MYVKVGKRPNNSDMIIATITLRMYAPWVHSLKEKSSNGDLKRKA